MSVWKSILPQFGGGWKPMRTESSAEDLGLPGKRGRYLLWLDPPLISGSPHWVHFSWMEESFCIRDYINGMERRQEPNINATQIWRSAKNRIPCRGYLYKPVTEFDFWKHKLEELTKSNPR